MNSQISNTINLEINKNEMYSNIILNKELFNDIERITNIDSNKYDPLFLTSNLMGLTSFLSLDKVFLTINQKEETTTNCMFINVGKSGRGKTQSNNFVLKALKEIEEQNFHFNEKIKEFCKACKELAFDSNETLGFKDNIIDTEHTDFVDRYYDNHFKDEPNVSRNDIYFTPNPANLYKPQFVATVYTEEGLRKGFKNSANSTLLLNSPELEILFENLKRTAVNNNPHTTLIDLVDGFQGIKLLVGGNDYQKGKVVVMTSTIFSKIEKYKASFFEQTTAYRANFVLGDNSKTNFFESRLGEFNTVKDTNPIEIFESRIEKLTHLLLDEFDKTKEPIKIDIQSKELFEFIKSELIEIRKEFFNEEKIESINIDYLDAINNRLEFKLLQTILIVHILNTAYECVLQNDDDFTSRLLNINRQSILRGINCYKYFLTNMFNLLDTPIITNLNETQQFIVDNLDEGDEMPLDEFYTKIQSKGYTNSKGDFKKVSKKTIQNFLNDDKSKPYFEIFQRSNKTKTIKRKLGV